MSQDKVVILVGEPLEKQTLYGPFNSFDEAAEWEMQNVRNEYTWIVTLKEPE